MNVVIYIRKVSKDIHRKVVIMSESAALKVERGEYPISIGVFAYSSDPSLMQQAEELLREDIKRLVPGLVAEVISSLGMLLNDDVAQTQIQQVLKAGAQMRLMQLRKPYTDNVGDDSTSTGPSDVTTQGNSGGSASEDGVTMYVRHKGYLYQVKVADPNPMHSIVALLTFPDPMPGELAEPSTEPTIAPNLGVRREGNV